MAPPTRRMRRSPETIFLQVFTVAILLGLLSILKSYHDTSAHTQHVISARGLHRRDEECREVHSHHDQCAFVRANCPDEEAGLLSYLELYFCSLPNAKPFAFIILVVWISVLFSTIGIAAADFLCLNLSTISSIMGMSESLAGVTFLAFGNGSPDVFSTFAAFSSHSGSLAVGELMGAAGFITAVVSGSMAITKPFQVARKSFVRDVLLFAIAAGFSLSFLRDGRLRLWECCAMVGFYILYVLFVVAWHWYFERQRRIRLAENSARLYHHIPDQQELDTQVYVDDEEGRPAAERSPLLRTRSAETMPIAPAPGTPAWVVENVDEDDEARDQYLAALSSNMRVSRTGRDRRNTTTPIRPSLIGALEFRSVLNALEKKSSTSQPIHMRRYSDEAGSVLAQAAESQAFVSQPELTSNAAQRASSSPAPERLMAGNSGRTRAVSANDASGLGFNSNLLGIPYATPETAIYSPNTDTSLLPSPIPSPHLPTNDQLSLQSQPQGLLLSPSSMSTVSAVPAVSSPTSAPSTRNGFLAPPGADLNRPDYTEQGSRPGTGTVSPGGVSPMGLVPKLLIPHPRSRSPSEWRYTDSPSGMSSHHSRPPSIHLPPPSMSPESSHQFPLLENQIVEQRLFKWWPYKVLPPPQLLLSTLFPGLYGWSERTWAERLIGICSAPSIFLLTITLPVVESKDDQDSSTEPESPVGLPHNITTTQSRSSTIGRLAPDSPSLSARGYNSIAVPQLMKTDEDDPLDSSPKDWNRWLAMVQCLTAPVFIVTVVWANLEDGSDVKLLIKMVLGALVFGLIALAVLISFTSPDREPKHRSAFCFLGFFVAIAWISTIANEVVGVLKALGVILNISDAILGLTIFAVGNSLGDLVADITVARLGFPMMALSACFGGPMLNILLGIGVGGLYQTLTNAKHKYHKHPDRPIKYKPYELDVSTTLMVSGITLLVTLVFLLVVVPLNKWRMDRKIGVSLIALWTVSTVLNVILEVLGIGEQPTTRLF